MKKKISSFVILLIVGTCLSLMAVASFFSLPTLEASVSKSFVNYTLTALQGYQVGGDSPYGYFDELQQATYSKDVSYVNENGETCSTYRAIEGKTSSVATSKSSSGKAVINLVGDMRTLAAAKNINYYAVASAGVAITGNPDISTPTIYLSINGKTVQASSSYEQKKSDVYSPDWIKTAKLFVDDNNASLTYSFSTCGAGTIWKQCKFYLFEPTVSFGVEVDNIATTLSGGSATTGQLIELSATNGINNLDGGSLLAYYKNAHQITWEIVEGNENAKIEGNFLKITGNSGNISIRPKCLKDTFSDEYIYGNTITYNISNNYVSLNLISNFSDAGSLLGGKNNCKLNSNIPIFAKVNPGFTFVKWVNEQGNTISSNPNLNNKAIISMTSSRSLKAIFVKNIEISNIIVSNKLYDKSTTAKIEEISIQGLDPAHDVSFTSTLTASFESALPGNNIKILLKGNVALVGKDSNYYNFNSTLPITTANILTRDCLITANNQTVEYGDAINLTYTAEGLLDGDFLSGGLSRDDGNTPGVYQITQGTLNNPYYNIIFVNGNLTISQRTILISNIYASNKEYNKSNEAVLNYTISKNFTAGEKINVSYTANFENENVGNDKKVLYSIYLVGTEKSYYKLNIESGTSTANITKKIVVVNANSHQKTYGQPDPVLTYTQTGLIEGDTLSGSLSRTTGESANNYPILVGSLMADNYLINFISNTFTINKKNITVVANKQTKIYGDSDPVLTYVASGLINGDTFVGSLSRESGNLIGSYKILLGSLSNQNYNISFTSSTFEIKTRKANVNINLQDKTYDGTASAVLDILIRNAVEEDNISLALYAEFKNMNAGIRSVNVYDSNNKIADFTNLSFLGNNLQCYEFKIYTNLTATIAKRETIISLADNAITSKIFGELEPNSFPYIATNLVYGETLVGKIARISGENAGSYQFNLGTLTNANNPNYNIVNNFNTNFIVTPRPIKLEIASNTIVYGDEESEINFSLSLETPLQNGFSLEDILEGSPSREEGTDAGVYKYTSGTIKIVGNSSNYELLFNFGTLTVTKRNINIVVNQKTKTYGSYDPAFDATITNESPNFPAQITFERTAGENVGTYNIVAVLGNLNYNADITNSSLEIVAANLTVKALNISKIYGESDPKLTYTITSGILMFNDTLESVFSGSLVRESGNNVGNYKIKKGTLSVLSNYNLNFTEANFEILNRPLTVRAIETNKFVEEDDPQLLFEITNLIDGDQLSGTLTREEGEDAGTYEILQGTIAINNYTITFISANFNIKKYEIVINIKNASKTYGELDPEFEFKIEGNWQAEQEFNGTLFRQTGENVGEYQINCNFTSDKFNATIMPAVLTITPRQVAISANAINVNYGDDIPSLTFTITEGSLVETDEFSGNLFRQNGVSVGEYLISSGLFLNNNYVLSYTPSFLTISKRPLTLTSQNYQKTYGGADPIFEYEITSGNLCFGDTLAGNITRQEGENFGEYALVCNLTNPNYEIAFESAKLTIVKKELVLVTTVLDKIFDGTNVAYIRSPKLSGIINGDDVTFNFNSESIARFATHEIGENIAVTFLTGWLEGISANNYYVTYPVGLTASITISEIDKVNVSVLASKSNTTWKSGTELICNQSNKAQASNLSTSTEYLGTYSLLLEYNGQPLEESGAVTININLNEKREYNNLQVYRINSDGTKTLIDHKINSNVLSFDTDELGTFEIYCQNDGWVNIALYSCIGVTALVAGTIAGVVFYKKKKAKCSNGKSEENE